MSDLPPVSLTDVIMALSRMSRELGKCAFELPDWERKYVTAKEVYTMAKAIAYLKSGEELEFGKPPTAATREARVVIATEKERVAMDYALVTFHSKRDEIDAIKDRLGAIRSSGTLLRAENELDKIR